MDPFEWLGFSLDDIILLDFILTTVWISFSIAGAIFLIYKSKFVNQFELVTIGLNDINIHIHVGIVTMKYYNVSPNHIDVNNFENSFCFKYNSRTNSTLLKLDLSHPMTGLIVGSFTSYYSRILPFIITLLLANQHIFWNINITKPFTYINRVIMKNHMGVILRHIFLILDAPFMTEQPTIHPIPMPISNTAMSSLLNIINNTPVQMPVISEAASAA